MGTHHVVSSVIVDRPAAAVADVVLDWGNDAAWRAAVTGFEVEPPGRAVVDQSLVETLVMAGLTFRTPTRVVEAAPLRARYRGGSRLLGVEGVRTVRALGARRCEVVTETTLTARGAMRPLARLLAPSYRRADAADLRALREHLVPEVVG